MAWGMGMNEICDLATTDRRAKSLNKVLVRGDISLKTAKIIVVMLAVATIILGTWIAWANVTALYVLTFGILFGVGYDLFSKKFVWAGLLAGGWVFCLILFSATIVVATVPVIVVLLSLFGCLFMIEMCSFQGSIKDLNTDDWNLGLHLGCYATKGGEIKLSATFVILAVIIKIMQITALSLILLYLTPSIIIVLLSTGFLAINIATFCGYLRIKNTSQRSKLKKHYSITAFSALVSIGVPLCVIIPVFELTPLMIIPLLWFMVCNLILYGSFIRPRW